MSPVGSLHAACTPVLARLYRRFRFTVVAGDVPFGGHDQDIYAYPRLFRQCHRRARAQQGRHATCGAAGGAAVCQHRYRGSIHLTGYFVHTLQETVDAEWVKIKQGAFWRRVMNEPVPMGLHPRPDAAGLSLLAAQLHEPGRSPPSSLPLKVCSSSSTSMPRKNSGMNAW